MGGKIKNITRKIKCAQCGRGTKKGNITEKDGTTYTEYNCPFCGFKQTFKRFW